MAYLYNLDVYVSPNRKYANLSLIYYILDFRFFMSQDDAYFHIHQNGPEVPARWEVVHELKMRCNQGPLLSPCAEND